MLTLLTLKSTTDENHKAGIRTIHKIFFKNLALGYRSKVVFTRNISVLLGCVLKFGFGRDASL